MKRVWDEVGCEFYDLDEAQFGYEDEEDDDNEVLAELHCVGVDPISIGYFNGGRHVYFEVSGSELAVKAFEEAFELNFEIYDTGLSYEDLAEIIPKCSADRLPFLRQRKVEFDEETKIADAEFEERQEKKANRWRANEWHDLERLAQAARDAGWLEKESGHHYGPDKKRYGFYHDIGPIADGNILRLELAFDDNRENHNELWLHESCLTLYKGGGTSSFGGWGMLPTKQYVWDIEFIDRWLGIPSPARAVVALKHVLTWNDHMRNCCAGFEDLL